MVTHTPIEQVPPLPLLAGDDLGGLLGQSGFRYPDEDQSTRLPSSATGTGALPAITGTPLTFGCFALVEVDGLDVGVSATRVRRPITAESTRHRSINLAFPQEVGEGLEGLVF